MSEKIKKLTKEQEAMIPVYLERYRAIGISTRPTDRSAAAQAVIEAYAYLKKPRPEIIWADSPFAGARIAAELAAGTKDVTKAQVADQASKASYGSLEAYWVAFYSFIGEQLPVEKDELLGIVNRIIEECGVYWTFDDTVVLTDKPTFISMVDGKLHNPNGKALEYKDGSGIFAYKGVRYSSLTELKIATLLKDEDAEKAG